MWDFLSKLVERIPPKFLVTVITIAVTVSIMWFGGLAVVAAFTARTVDFWPPKISRDPELLKAIQGLTAQAERSRNEETGIRGVLIGEIVSIRRKTLESGNLSGCDSSILKQAQSDWETYEARYSERMQAIQELSDRIAHLERKI